MWANRAQVCHFSYYPTSSSTNTFPMPHLESDFAGSGSVRRLKPFTKTLYVTSGVGKVCETVTRSPDPLPFGGKVPLCSAAPADLPWPHSSCLSSVCGTLGKRVENRKSKSVGGFCLGDMLSRCLQHSKIHLCLQACQRLLGEAPLERQGCGSVESWAAVCRPPAGLP